MYIIRLKIFNIGLLLSLIITIGCGRTRKEKTIAINSEFNIVDNEKAKVELSTIEFEPIQIDREDGFYACVDYKGSISNNHIILEGKPLLTSNDIFEVEKVYSKYDEQAVIRIVFTEKGARKYHLLTKENIGKPIAIVISKYIISMPIVREECSEGQVSIVGNFSEDEIDRIVKKLNRS